ncbi:conserved hypothetical protein [Devosia lucknowensis]|uniref:Purine nucleoside phosphorylase n=1 Tax=Devosia lucknowensis TaxID=1096929 RepID=A0A1Y6FG19_9HYPH|nr:peptidoglycan editing factor PgeF [Devosia lucknowensis]SMQ71822.1 conserved hypothetical protein [Devosia lucknowensis]
MIPFETAPSLAAQTSIRHGFFGRAGGRSQVDFAGLNVSTSVGDDPETVENNRLLVSGALNVGPLAILRQTHSTRVATIVEPIEPGSIDADALVSATPGLALGILTADCTPILFFDPQAGVIGAAHAGWRGAVDGIIEETVSAMVTLGAHRDAIIAAFGPTIHAANYEVGDSFRRDFLTLHPDGAGHFHTPPEGAPHFDLPGFVAKQLRAAGVATVEQVGACTYAHPDRYFSHRYATHRQTRTGRQISVIGLT